MNRRCKVAFVPMAKFREISLGRARLVLPSGAEIVHATPCRDSCGDGMGYLISAPHFPEVPRGEQLPRVTPVIQETA